MPVRWPVRPVHGRRRSTDPTASTPTGGRAGRRGDFITSAEVGPLFGAVVARFLDAEWRTARRSPTRSPSSMPAPAPARWHGRSWPRRRRARPRCATSPSTCRRPSGRCTPTASSRGPSSPTGPFDGVIIANELLDNLPFRLAVYDDGWREAYVVAVARRAARRSSSARRSIPCPASLPRVARARSAGARSRTRARAVGRRRLRSTAGRHARRDRLHVADHRATGGAAVARLAAHLPAARTRRPLPRRRRARRTSRPRSPIDQLPEPEHRADPGPVAAAARHRRTGRRGPAVLGRTRRATRSRGDPDAESGVAKPRRCSTRPGSAGSPCSSGVPETRR